MCEFRLLKGVRDSIVCKKKRRNECRGDRLPRGCLFRRNVGFGGWDPWMMGKRKREKWRWTGCYIGKNVFVCFHRALLPWSPETTWYTITLHLITSQYPKRKRVSSSNQRLILATSIPKLYSETRLVHVRLLRSVPSALPQIRNL